MKLKNIFSLVVAAMGLAACSTDNEVAGSLGDFQLSETYVTIPATGGTKTVSLNSAVDWAFSNVKLNDNGNQVRIVNASKGTTDSLWCHLSQLSGTAGSTELAVTAAACDYGREVELQIGLGNGLTQFMMVRQGDIEAQTATCAEVTAGADGKTYRVKGTCTAIANTTYGNWYLTDNTGQIYIYGTLDKDGAQKNFSSLGIEEGDVVTVEGPKTTYGTTVELVNVTVIKIEKSLVKVLSEKDTLSKDGGELTVKVAYKGSGVYPTISSDCQSWVTYKSTEIINGVPSKIEANPADTAIVKFNVAANDGGARTGSITFASSNSDGQSSVEYSFLEEGGIVERSIAEFNAAEVGSTVYRLSGVVTSIKSTNYGNFYIKDYSGETYVYGLANFGEAGIDVGDIVTLTGTRGQYKTTIEVLNASLESKKDVEAITVADFLTKADDANTYYMLTGTVSNIKSNTYGNYNLTDETGTVYIYGTLAGWNGPSKQFESMGITEGTKVTLITPKTSYNGTAQGKNAILFSKE